MPTIYAWAAAPGDIGPGQTAGWGSTTDSQYRPSASPVAMTSPTGATPQVLAWDTPTGAAFGTSLHVGSRTGNSVVGRAVAHWLNGSTNVARMVVTATDTFAFELWNGSTWDQVITGLAHAGNARAKLDFWINLHDTTGLIEVYRNGVLLNSFSGDTLRAGVTGVDRLQMQCLVGSAESSHYSEIFVCDEKTNEMYMDLTSVTGAGALTGFSGAFGQISDITASNPDTTWITAATAGLESTYATDAASTTYQAGYDVVAVGVKARGRKGPASPIDGLEAAIRSGTTMSYGTEKTLGDGSFEVVQHIAYLDPATGTAWTYTTANSAQPGVRAKA